MKNKNQENQEKEGKFFSFSFSIRVQRKRIYSLLAFIGIGVIIFFASISYFIPEFTEIFLKDAQDFLWRDFFEILFNFLILYVIISIEICFFVRMLKQKELKKYPEKGLITGLIISPIENGLIYGLTVSLIAGLIIGIIKMFWWEFK